MIEVTRCFCWHKNFVPNGLSAPAWGYIHVEKHEKKKKEKKFFMGAAILFQKVYVVSNGKPTLPPAIRRKHWPEWYC